MTAVFLCRSKSLYAINNKIRSHCINFMNPAGMIKPSKVVIVKKAPTDVMAGAFCLLYCVFFSVPECKLRLDRQQHRLKSTHALSLFVPKVWQR